MYCLLCVVLCIVCVYMCNVLLPPGGYQIAVNKCRVSQEEWAKLRESVPYVKIYRYNPKHLYPKLSGYGDNGLLAVSRNVPAQLTALPVHCACPSLRVSLLPTSRLRYERLVSCTDSAVQTEREVVHMYARKHVTCKVLGNPKDD
jgi:hypothetical protein